MKFIHTADWHLGNSMHDIDRQTESAQFLAWLKSQIIETGAQALVVSGDIFDTTTPSNEAKSQYYRFLASLLETDCKNVVIVGGNHDSASLLDAPCDILDALNIQVVGSIANRTPQDLVREFKDAAGNAIAICAAVPYTRENEIRKYVTDTNAVFADNANKGLYKAVFDAAEALREGRDIPLIATGHLYAAGLEGRPENDNGEGMKNSGVRDIVGNLGTVPVTVFPEGFDYVALGHIHYTTTVEKKPKVRYSGSPFILGFDEAKIKHHVLLVEVNAGEIPSVEKIETPEYFEFMRIQGTNDEIRNTLRELRKNPGTKPLKLEIVYEYTPGVNIREFLASELDQSPFEVVNWKTSRSDSLSAADFSDDSLDDVSVLGDEDIFKRLIMMKNGVTEMDENLQKTFDEFYPLFKQLAEEVENENRE
ncbi:exonuclease subunit SbcD [Fibrobacter sp.]|uniref:exonuclease subunit SbcD n=1 Tax=Fibrobacter sp. TaxID=35828 RepID=UPI00388E0BEE